MAISFGEFAPEFESLINKFDFLIEFYFYFLILSYIFYSSLLKEVEKMILFEKVKHDEGEMKGGDYRRTLITAEHKQCSLWAPLVSGC